MFSIFSIYISGLSAKTKSKVGVIGIIHHSADTSVKACAKTGQSQNDFLLWMWEYDKGAY